MSSGESGDAWSRWILHSRFGGDTAMRDRVMESLGPVRDRVIDGTRIAPGDTLLDAGCGDGFIGFEAIERHPDSRIIFVDISEPLLEECRRIADASGVVTRCQFVEAGVERLAPIPDTSVDAVALRSVLIYVEDKASAFSTFFRVLKRGGRLSLFEPINAFTSASSNPVEFWGYDARPIAAIAEKVSGLYERLQPPDDPMRGFDERDLVALAEEAGFDHIELDLSIRVHREVPEGQRFTWGQFIGMAPNPNVPSIAQAMEQVLSPEEREAFTAHLRPLIEAGAGTVRMAHAFLTAQKPTDGGSGSGGD